MKICFSIIATILTLALFGQDTARFTATVKGWQSDSGRFPISLDSVYLNSTFQQTIKVYTRISATDSVFRIPDIPIGKYWLKFASKQYCVRPLSIVVCSKCDNEFYFFSFPRKQGSNCDIFTIVEISPGYLGGNKSLSKDFKRSLSKKEIKQLQLFDDFSIHFYVTKQKVVSDITFSQALPQPARNIIAKGLMAVTNWNPGFQNGSAVDAEYRSDKNTLLNK